MVLTERQEGELESGRAKYVESSPWEWREWTGWMMRTLEIQHRLKAWLIKSERLDRDDLTCRGGILGYIGRRMLEMHLPGKRQWGRPYKRHMNAVREDMEVVGVRDEDVDDGYVEEDDLLWRPLKRDQQKDKGEQRKTTWANTKHSFQIMILFTKGDTFNKATWHYNPRPKNWLCLYPLLMRWGHLDNRFSPLCVVW